MSSHKYYLRSTPASPSSSSVSSPSTHSESSGSTETPIGTIQLPAATTVSPFFTGYIPEFRPVFRMSDHDLDPAQGDQMAQAEQIDVIGGSQQDLDLLPGQFHDAQEMGGQSDEEQPVLRNDSSQLALSTVDNEHKRNKINSLLERIKEHVGTLKEEMLDQVSPSILNTDFSDLAAMLKSYNTTIGDILDVPVEDNWSPALRTFIDQHREHYKNTNTEVNALKLKIKRLLTLENAKSTTSRPPLSMGTGSSTHSSALKLPRLQIPRFENNASGSVDWDNFRNLMTKLTADLDPQEKIFILKSALTGESSKLVANELSYEQAMRMLTSVYGNELLQLQSKIQGFIALVQQEPLEKNHAATNRTLCFAYPHTYRKRECYQKKTNL